MQLRKFLPALLALVPVVQAQDSADAQSLEKELSDLSKQNVAIQRGFLPQCKCVQGERCWPSSFEWAIFNILVGDNLIRTSPVAQSCYPGPAEDLEECANVVEMWSDQDFQTNHPIGRPYPYNITCPPVDYNAGEKPGSCIHGSLPTYAVEAKSRKDIWATLLFARLRNIRLALSGTGHDLLGRSEGFSSLELWLHSFKNGIDFQETYKSENQCAKGGWKGSAIKIDGNYQWRDVYKIAKENNVIVVGGGAVSPGAIGGWANGGGHGPATRNYGMGADQILEAEVMLADGRVVTANACENTDLYRALRGGGPGYGVTLSSTVKAHPNVDVVTAHKLAFAPLVQTELNADLLDAVATLLQHLPDLNDAGFAGYGFWFRNFPGPFVGNATSGYNHGFWTIGQGKEEAEKAWAPVREALSQYEDKLFIHESWATYDDYWSFYEAESGLYDPTGSTSILSSRLINPSALEDYDALRSTIEITSGKPTAFDSNVILLTSGGQTFKDGLDPNAGLLPGWRESHFAIVSSAGLPDNPTLEERWAANDEVTYTKGKAMEKLAPGTGGYMNEGDRNDPNWQRNFYGELYETHARTKRRVDPFNTFYCATCVGSEGWIERPDGPLCRA